jgi:hypothetical protein
MGIDKIRGKTLILDIGTATVTKNKCGRDMPVKNKTHAASKLVIDSLISSTPEASAW